MPDIDNNRLYEIFFANASDLFCAINNEGTIALANPAFHAFFGQATGPQQELNFYALLHADDRETTRTAIKNLNKSQADTSFSVRFQPTGSQCLTLSWSAKNDPANDLVLLVARDTSDSLKYQAEVERILDILNETGKIARVGGWELDVATEELTWTDETFRILEVEKQADQKPVLPEGLKLFTLECQPVIERAVERAITHGEPYSLELQAQTAKGNVLWVYTNGRANYKNGQVVSLSGTIQDIHARKMAELRYEQERQRNIKNAKLASLGELAASMAHEINNPLGIISGSAELIKLKGELPETTDAKIDNIMKSCQRISHIVKSLRRFSRVDDNKDKRLCHLAGIIQEAATLAKPRLKTERVKLELELDDNIEILCIDIEIEQVLLNLINNAIDAMETSQERWITITLTKEDHKAVLRVTDSGKGIDDNFRNEMFSPFVTSKKLGKGTGLGLAVVDGILKDHLATITLDENSRHTCFMITFAEQ